MAEYTEYYNLKKPTQTENYDVDVANVNNAIIDTTLYGKVDKIAGKSLSTNDFTDGYKKKIDSMQTLYRFKGTVETVQELNLIESKNIGDVYKCNTDLNDYIWNGQEWINIGKDADFESILQELKKVNDIFKENFDDMSKDYTGTNITATTKEGYGTINKLYGKTEETGTGEKSPTNPHKIECVGTLENGKYKVEVISKNGEKQDSNIVYTDRPLCRMKDENGNILLQDYIDYTNKKIIRQCGYTVLNGAENWTKSSVTDNDIFVVTLSNIKVSDNAFCNAFEFYRGTDQVGKFYTADGNKIAFVYSPIGTTTLEQFKTFLQNTHVVVVYELANATVEPIVCTNKIKQFDGETIFQNQQGAEMEITCTNNKAVAEINGDTERVETNINSVQSDVSALKTIKNYSNEVVLQNGYTHVNAFLASPQIQRIRKYGTS